MSNDHGTSNHHHVVILGGGITGLSAAFHLARKHPTAQITLIEKSTRFGGWVRSERVDVRDARGNTASVLLEAGPRTLRPNATAILELVHLLDLRSEVLYTPRASPAARNKFLHVPPAQGLQPLPHGLLSLITLPLGRLVLRSALAEPFVLANHPPPRPPPPSTETAETTIPNPKGTHDEHEHEYDESVDSFLSRRFGTAFARTLGSALVHGIYAADSRALSVRAAFPMLPASEARGKGSVVWGELGPPAWFSSRAQAQEQAKAEGEGDREWETRFRADAALFSFREGMETLVRALVEALRRFPNVVLWSGTAARWIDTDAVNVDGDACSFQIYLDGADAIPPSLKATHIISALPLPVLDSILQPPAAPASTGTHQPLPHLRANPHSSVTVLNLVFPSRLDNKTETRTTTTPLHPPGFGYLIPRPEHGYPSTPGAETEAEPELGLLGVVFDTASLPEQDEDAGARFTKMTAMLGGPYPYPYLRADADTDDTSSDAHFVAAVVHRISEHLGHMLPPPVHYVVHRNNASIPTYLVGHTARMVELDRALRARWGGRMKVIGSGVGGVSVADCVTAGRQAAREVGAQIGN